MSQFIEMYYNTHNKQTLESVCPIMNKGITPKYVESSSVLVINQACIHWDGQRLGNIKYHNEEIPVRKRILESGDVLLNATGNGTLGRCCVFICPSDNNTYINDGHVIALSTDRAVILPEVLNTYLSLNDTQAEIYRQYVTGSTNQVDIVFSDIKKMKVPVPSMDEQILFVEVLTQADKSEFVGCKSQFIEIFYGMETTPVKDYIDDSFPGEWGTEDKDGNGVKVIRTTNFTNSGKLNLADVVTRSIEDRKVVRKQIKKYDTILERSGGTADNPVGRVVLFEEDNLFLCNNFTQVLRFKDVDPRFAFYALYYFYQTNRTAIRSMGSKTTGIQNLNMSKYLEIGIPNASDEDQKAFVTIAEQADKSEYYN
ncbi:MULTISPECIES: restriction endonuclease subunit S [Bacteroidales]|jgi:restriction endonuclease S subunit|nr:MULTISPECIES: restriction endonuclease subunit S [Bacteroidaceae]MCM1611914.1 restriction endonuclease subunit S [Phocaeicola vulgatus]